ncbi:MAG: NUDIX hydrolase [Acidimicrobiia bacterium]|nr:NUDIX hydrolase [Acidimicrobiia bacterium]
MTIPSLRPAATVVLLRASPGGLRTCLVRRHDEIAFMGGAYVFPGGSVGAADRTPGAETLCDGLDAAAAQLGSLDRTEAIAHHLAAIREAFEESGILLARPSALDAGRLAAERARLSDGRVTIGEIAQALAVRLACDALVYAAHWRTPAIEISRFDVRFFLAEAPEGQEVRHDGREAVDSLWIDPAEALDRCRSGEILLAPPTWTMLRTLEQLGGVDDALAWARARHVVPVDPVLFEENGRRTLALPGDPQYPESDGVEPLRESRFVFTDGRWAPAVHT